MILYPKTQRYMDTASICKLPCGFRTLNELPVSFSMVLWLGCQRRTTWMLSTGVLVKMRSRNVHQVFKQSLRLPRPRKDLIEFVLLKVRIRITNTKTNKHKLKASVKAPSKHVQTLSHSPQGSTREQQTIFSFDVVVTKFKSLRGRYRESWSPADL